MSGTTPIILSTLLGGLQTGVGLAQSHAQSRAAQAQAEEMARREQAELAERRRRQELEKTRQTNAAMARQAAMAAGGGMSMDGSTAAIRENLQSRYDEDMADIDRAHSYQSAIIDHNRASARQRSLLDRQRTQWSSFLGFARAGLDAYSPPKKDIRG